MKPIELREMLKNLEDVFYSLGYARAKKSFWKVNDRVFQLVDFQAGAHGNYFFINLCLHPVGFPLILSDSLAIPETPLEYECIIRRRVEQVSGSAMLDCFRMGLVPPSSSICETIKKSLVVDVEPWMRRWGARGVIAGADREEIRTMVNVVPSLKERAAAMLQYYCFVQIGRLDDARKVLAEFKAMPSGKWRFEQVDDYLESLLIP